MECKVCGKSFAIELTFARLFVLPWCCPDCERAYRPGLFEESIPYSGGLIDYVSVYPVENRDFLREQWLFRYMEKCFKRAICDQSSYGVIFLIGEVEFEQAPQWLPFLRGFERVLFFSLFYFDFIDYEDYM